MTEKEDMKNARTGKPVPIGLAIALQGYKERYPKKYAIEFPYPILTKYRGKVYSDLEYITKAVIEKEPDLPQFITHVEAIDTPLIVTPEAGKVSGLLVLIGAFVVLLYLLFAGRRG